MSAQTIQQLESARSLALGDGRYYPTIIPGVLPIIGYSADNQAVDIQRWGADFIAEAFASPTWPQDAKETSASSVLATLKDYLEHVDDKSVTKSVVQAAASIYPLVYRHVVSNPNDAQDWQLMSAIKSSILRRMDSATPGVRICCIKFLQQAVLVQTPGVVDPRRPDGGDISLALVSRDHPVIPYASLEAEGLGLLDRLLDIIHGDHSDGLVVTATLNSLGILMHRRPIAANKILNSVLNFNALKLANAPMTPKNKVIIKSIERTTRALLVNIMKRHPENQVNGRIQQYLERMHRTRIEIFDESRKRPAPSGPNDGLEQAKRQRVTVEASTKAPSVPPLPAGEVSWRQLYTLNPEGKSTVNFDVQMFKDPEQLLRIVVPVLQSVDAQKLDHAINIVRSRYLSLSQAATKQAAAKLAAAPAAEDEEEYEPDFEPEDAEQIVNRLDGYPATDVPQSGPGTALAPYKLPEAPPLSEQEVQKYGDQTVYRAFGMLASVDETQKTKANKSGFNRLAATDYGRDAWVTILSRLATRANAGLDDPESGVKDEYAVKGAKGSTSISEAVRDGIYNYILHDWKRRIDVAISWLNEEWYNDKVLAQQTTKNGVNGHTPSNNNAKQGNYQRCALRMFDGILGFIEHTDKVLIRFLSEVPELDHDILSRLKIMARDPERIDLACQTLQYLYMFRPPVRKIVVDTLAELWQENDRAKPSARKLLLRWRPEVLGEERSVTPAIKAEGDGQMARDSANGSLEVKAAS
ncbi:hypothetical protein HBH98_052280 [Parastagonospora nodorum]|nr:hypothetical protein HBH43_157200 [Parastagonospora nodorum]KAH4215195.1 hypothetical protein HBI95_018460 [Parastagonospora nodorum]KAH4350679.1 hypothetical protein HBH98_052280 [Parastagonospora nodorum]KAH4363004.1 hypothetical protein HBH97_188210 [Parastagonospora nodorum]KAH4424605.1 hypothetical protein HBH99_039850 [Parastagonospora nodorum]